MTSEVTDRVEIYKDSANRWRWRRRAANNEIVSTSEDSFFNFSWAEKSAHNYNRDVTNFEVIDHAE